MARHGRVEPLGAKYILYYLHSESNETVRDS
jgi:hypothetical protein